MVEYKKNRGVKMGRKKELREKEFKTLLTKASQPLQSSDK